ncbi:MAG: hypothetical protein PHV99_00130 [Candidatus Pacebacteria bacterium]|nr:hypothetical protein [Candidatus Paceibacterota bacterium]
MKTIFEHIEHIKGKPHHIRKRVAYAAAACGASLIALIWLAGSISTNAFAISGNSFAESVEKGNTLTTGADTTATSQLAGAGAAAVLQDAETPAHIEIVNTTPEPSKGKQAEQTTLPF